ncbi:hypothetical protein T01_1493 [Trichinella spiralis]|uniref:Uncharacterized protein n=1 Tax=Trichinella spiralis TaxID=6334 RepID=A0A0V1BRW3_TRISP|nr:hypothetical protein T01_1493 [Trichinella spiralis]
MCIELRRRIQLTSKKAEYLHFSLRPVSMSKIVKVTETDQCSSNSTENQLARFPQHRRPKLDSRIVLKIR